MIERDLRTLLDRPADRRLDTLESDIWTRLELQGRQRLVRRVRMMQSALAAAAFAASVLAGMRSVRPAPPELDVFSARVALSSSALVGERQP